MAKAFVENVYYSSYDYLNSDVISQESEDKLPVKLMITILPKTMQLKSNVYSKTLCFNNTQIARLKSNSSTVNNLTLCDFNAVPSHLKVLIPDKFIVSDEISLCAEMLTLIANDTLTATYFSVDIYQKFQILQLLKATPIIHSLCNTFCHQIPHSAEEFRLTLEKLDPHLLEEFFNIFNHTFKTNFIFKMSYIENGKLLSDFAKKAVELSDSEIRIKFGLTLNKHDAKNIKTLMYNNLSNIAKAKIQQLEFITDSINAKLIHCCTLCAKPFEEVDLLVYNTPCCNISTHIDCMHIFDNKCTICNSEFYKLNSTSTKIIKSIRAIKANSKRLLFVVDCETHLHCTIYKCEGVTLHFNKTEFMRFKDTDLLQWKLEHHVISNNYMKDIAYRKSIRNILDEFENIKQ